MAKVQKLTSVTPIKKPALGDIVHPIIQVDGETHPLVEMFNEERLEDLPILTSVGYMRLGTGVANWVSYVMKTQGDKVLSIIVDELNLRAIAEESAKINFVQSFIDQE